MKHFGAIPIVLFAITSTVIAQSVHIDVRDKSLNNVLNRIGFEVSFDDEALSEYRVTVSRTFESPEKALAFLLENKPFSVEKIGRIYVIFPRIIQPEDDIPPEYRDATIERFIFNGTVVSQTGNVPLEYATISLLGSNNQLLISGITDAEGRFTIQSTRIPAKIKISHIGYGTVLNGMNNLNRELGAFVLNENFILLDEIVVTNHNHKPEMNRFRYPVTPEMRAGVDNGLELLGKIPGVSFDKSSSIVRLNQNAAILFLVDEIQYPQSWLKHLSPHRIQAVEVITALSGRYVSDDYAGIIKLVLDKDYTGYGVNVLNNTSLNLSKTAEKSRLPENRPSIGLVYTTRKLNIFGTYDYSHENSALHTSKSLAYNLYELSSKPATQANNLYRHDNHVIGSGLNYHITPLHLLGVQADYASGNTYSFQEFTMFRTDPTNNYNKILNNKTLNIIQSHTFAGSLFYRGQIANRLHLFGDLSYNYYYNDIENDYRQDEAKSYHYADFWNEYKNQTTLNIEAKYTLSGKTAIEAGYSNIWRQYASASSQGKGFLDYNEHRNKAFTYLIRYPSEKAGWKAGIAVEHIRQRNPGNVNNRFRVLPYMRINYKINSEVNMAASYNTSQSYPSLYQLSPMNIVIDTFLIQAGNPVLKSAIRHQAMVEIMLWNKLLIAPQLNYINDGISEVYDRKVNNLYRTFDNIDFRDFSLHASYNQTLGKAFSLKNTVEIYHREAFRDEIRNSVNGWTFHSEVDYYHQNASFGAQAGYNRNMRKNILWQGYQMSDKDYWFISARKELWQNRISVTVLYIPPVSFGVRYDRTKEMDTSLYKERTTSNLFAYSQMLLLKVSLRLERGSRKPSESRTDRIINERE